MFMDHIEFLRAAGRKGGKARAKKLTPYQRSRIAKYAVTVRELKKKELALSR